MTLGVNENAIIPSLDCPMSRKSTIARKLATLWVVSLFSWLCVQHGAYASLLSLLGK